MGWKCEVCGTVNQSELKGTVTCRACHEIFVVVDEAPLPKRTSEEWLGAISTQLEAISKSLKDSEDFREKEKKVLGEIESILRRYK